MEPTPTAPVASTSCRRRRGRRSLSGDGPSVPVSVNLPPPVYARLKAIADRMDLRVPELIRRALARELPNNSHI